MIADWKSAGSWIALETPEYIFEVEEWRRGEDQMVFVHLLVLKWNLTALKRMVHAFSVFRECVTVPVYACGEVDDAKWRAFVALFGFKPLTEVECTDGKRRRLYIHIKELPNVRVTNPEADPKLTE